MNFIIIIWYIIAASAAAAPIPLIKKYTETNNINWIILSALSYSLLIYAYSVILQDKNIAIVYPILKVLSVIIVIIAGILLFKSTLDNRSILGICLGAISIYLLSSKIDTK
jgi:uncharacterized membrane protein